MNKKINEKSNILTDSVKYSSVRYITLFASLLNTVLLSRIRTLEEYGTFSQLLLVTNLVVSIVALGIPGSMNYFLAKESEGQNRNHVVSVYYTLNTIISIAIAVVFNLSIKVICSFFNNPNISNYVYFLMIIPWASIIQTSIENVLIVYNRMNTLSIYKLTLGVFTLCIAILTKFFEVSFSEYVLFYTTLQVLYSVLVYVIVFFVTDRKLRVSIDKTKIKEILVFSIPLGFGMMLNTLNVEIDKLMIGHWFSVDEMAIYSNASIELPIYIFCSSLTVIALPRIAKYLKDKDLENACTIWRDTFSLGYIILSFLAFGIIVFSKDVISLVYSDKYLPGQAVFIIYSISILLYRCTYYGMFLNAGGYSKMIMYASIITVITNIILNPILYKLLGFVGPAIASAFSLLISNVVTIIFTKKQFDIMISRIIPWKTIMISTSGNLVLGVLFAALKQFLQIEKYTGEIIESIILAFLWGLLFLLFAYKPVRLLINRIKTYS